MKDKIIFWLDGNFINFGLANAIQKNFDCELYGIIDITDKPKKFFQQQKIVNFQKIWYYHDYIKKEKTKPDISYLQSFETKYGIDLWLLAQNERIFYDFNDYCAFTPDEILLILEQECKLFENVLDEIKPDFLIMATPTFHHNYLFYLLCERKGIKILVMAQTRFGYRCMISKKADIVDDVGKNSSVSKQRKWEELQQFFSKSSISNELKEYRDEFQSSSKLFLKASLQFLSSENTNEKTHYTYYGRTKLRVLFKTISYLLKTKYRQHFINKNFIYNITPQKPFIYFPLAVDQEQTILLGAPFYTNQLEVIKSIVKAMPIGFELYVKEHYLMNTRAWRKTPFYKEIMNMPHVKLIHPSVKSEILLEQCSLVIAILGTSCLEAAFFKKPSIILEDIAKFSDHISSIIKLGSFTELPIKIKTALQTQVDINELNKYVDLIESNSFEFNMTRLILDYGNHFYIGSNLANVDITEEHMNSFLEKNKETFALLASEHIKKIKQYKEHDTN